MLFLVIYPVIIVDCGWGVFEMCRPEKNKENRSVARIKSIYKHLCVLSAKEMCRSWLLLKLGLGNLVYRWL